MQIKDEALDLAETRFAFFSNVSQSFTEEVPRKIARIASLSTSRRVIAALCNTCNVVLAFVSG